MTDFTKRIAPHIAPIHKRSISENVVINLRQDSALPCEQEAGRTIDVFLKCTTHVYYLPKISFKNPDEGLNFLEATLNNHLKKYGAIRELRIIAHGKTGIISIGEEGAAPIALKDLLHSLQKVMHIHKPKNMLERVVFLSCNLFSRLDDKQIGLLREFSKVHGVELVGATSKVVCQFATFWKGRFVRFGSTGSVSRDPYLDTPFYTSIDLPSGLFADNLSRKNFFESDDWSWKQYHLHRSQKQAELTRDRHEASAGLIHIFRACGIWTKLKATLVPHIVRQVGMNIMTP